MTTIDNIVKEKNLGIFELIRIDIQGSEYYAMQGAKETLRNAEVIITETEILQLNANAPSFYKMQSLMNYLGFAFYDFGYENRNERHLVVSFDVTWVKKSSTLWDEKCTTFPAPAFYERSKKKLE
jgi:hypothetical protein